MELDPSSRYITTFATHIGLYRYKRLNFGITCAAEIFQNTMSQLIADITGAFNYSDDILIHAPTKEQHDIILDKVLKRLEENELTVSSDKCVFDQEEIEFYGMIFSAKGVRLSKSKINAIQNAKPPKNANEVRSFLGLANYVSRFIKDYATTAEPLWKLTKPATKWNWGKEQEEAFEKTKKSLTTVAMAYYNSDWETELITDASPVGLGAILTQYNSKNPDEKTIVAYASRILSDTERRYSHIEKEALASVWGCERFHIYIYGRQFKLITDNKATELIYKNPRSKPPARIQRWHIRLNQYDFRIIHRAGKTNIADFLSRQPIENPEKPYADEYVNYIEKNAVPKAISLERVIEETKNDKVLQKVIKMIKSDKKTNDPELKPYEKIKSELTITNNNVILRDNQIIMPKSLQETTIELAHRGHQGLEKTKRLLRSKAWFPGKN